MAVEPADGAVRWSTPMEFLVFGNNAFDGDILLVGTTNGKLHGFSRKTGERLWSFLTPTYTKNRLKYFKENDSYRDDIYSIITSNEQFLDVEVELGGVFSTPALDGDRVVFTSTNGSIYCLKR